MSYCIFFFNDTATTEIYTLSLHDALPILRLAGGQARAAAGRARPRRRAPVARRPDRRRRDGAGAGLARPRSEEHTSELQSRQYLVCRLLLEKKTIKTTQLTYNSQYTYLCS